MILIVIKLIKFSLIYGYQTIFNGYKIIFEEEYNTWVVLKNGSPYHSDLKMGCFEFVCNSRL